MKKSILFLITIILFSCSNVEDSNSIKEITILSSKKVRIGDTIVLSGENLNQIEQLRFSNRFQQVIVDPIYKSNEVIKVIVPVLNDENFNIYMSPNPSGFNLLPFKLIGTFPLPKSNIFSDGFVYLNNTQMLNENIAFTSDRNKIFKSINGGYNWTILKEFNKNISGMFFLNENIGWVSFSDNSDFNFQLHFTNDGGNTFNNILNINEFGKSITKIYFSSENKGYLLTSKGEIYKTIDNSNFELVYNFPNSNEGSNYPEFYKLSVYNDNLIASGDQADQPGFIRKINNNYDHIPSVDMIMNVQLISELKAYFVMKNSDFEDKLYFSNNFDSNWQETSDKRIHNFYFVNGQKGIGVSSNQGNFSHIIFETYDGGKNWINKFSFQESESCTDIHFYKNIGLITGYDGRIWKHIFE
jgi:hypothetical protein